MEFVNLGQAGLKVSRLCLGTMVFGAQCDEVQSALVLDAAAELGINFLDTADVYPVPPDLKTAGRTEEIVGRWLRGKRDRFVVATKFTNPMGPGPNDQGGGRKHVIEACEASLRRLGVERIDLYYMHRTDESTPVDETLEALDRLVQDGKVYYVGLSNFEAWQLGLAEAIVREHRLAAISALQPRYNLLFRQPERDLFPFCRAAGIGVMPYNPLGAGMLTGKYQRGQQPPPESRFGWGEYGQMYQGRYWSEEMFSVVGTLMQVAEQEGMTPAQAALAWVLSRDAVTSPIVGASRPEQLRETVKSLEAKLSEQAVAKLDEASKTFL
ncbi:MAG: aldo/keto reductase [Chloroflexi bacterium]|nr:MAG: aldo/keto reductase [Chloroflexota bacterium]TME17035.1 MAG: aldo/keto reductase [Chloroflexota bacterium]